MGWIDIECGDRVLERCNLEAKTLGRFDESQDRGHEECAVPARRLEKAAARQVTIGCVASEV